MNEIVSFLRNAISDPFAAIPIAILTNAAWDGCKYLYSKRNTNLPDKIAMELVGVVRALNAFASGKFIVELFHAMALLVTLVGCAVSLVTIQVMIRVEREELGSFYFNIEKYGVVILLIVTFFFINLITQVFRSRYALFRDPTVRLDSILKKIEALPSDQRDPLLMLHAQASAKVDQLQLR